MLPQPSVAVIVNVRVGAQAVPPSTCVTLIVTEPELSVAATCAFTLASVGKFAGLQPRFAPVGTLVITGAVVSAVQV